MKAGDKVRCVNDLSIFDLGGLVVGGEYTVDEVEREEPVEGDAWGGMYLWLVELPDHVYDAHRFEVIE